MNCLKRAILFIKRKKSKTCLLLLLFLISNTTILVTILVLSASDKVNQQIREKTNSKVIVEVSDNKKLLNQEEADQILENNHVISINRMIKEQMYPNNFVPFVGNEETDDGQVTILGYDDMEKDSPFEENICRLIKGDYAKNMNGVVINQILADNNNLTIGDEIELMSLDGKKKDLTITGLYLTGNERQQTESVATVNRIENQVYTTTELLCTMNGDAGFNKIVAYVNDPEQLSKIKEELVSFFEEKVEVGTIDTVYQKLKFSIIQIERITRLIFILTVITSIIVIEMLLCMWMRNRKTEIAVFISLGISKVKVFMQMLLEVWIVYAISTLLSAGIVALLLPEFTRFMSLMGNVDLIMKFSALHAVLLGCAGLIVLSLLVLGAMIPCFRKRIKDTLSEMEG